MANYGPRTNRGGRAVIRAGGGPNIASGSRRLDGGVVALTPLTAGLQVLEALTLVGINSGHRGTIIDKIMGMARISKIHIVGVGGNICSHQAGTVYTSDSSKCATADKTVRQAARRGATEII